MIRGELHELIRLAVATSARGPVWRQAVKVIAAVTGASLGLCQVDTPPRSSDLVPALTAVVETAAMLW